MPWNSRQVNQRITLKLTQSSGLDRDDLAGIADAIHVLVGPERESGQFRAAQFSVGIVIQRCQDFMVPRLSEPTRPGKTPDFGDKSPWCS